MTQRLGRAGVQWVVGGFSLSLSLSFYISLSLSVCAFVSQFYNFGTAPRQRHCERIFFKMLSSLWPSERRAWD